MKKIISAIALGAIITSAATADVKVNLNYRTGAEIYRNEGGKNESNLDTGRTATWFDLVKHNGGKDNLGLQVSGDVLSAKATLQPTQNSNNVVFHIMELGAKFGNLTLTSGWNGDGKMIGSYRVKNAADAGNEEGKYFESYKLGSIFKDSYALIADNPVALKNTDRTFFAMASYKMAPTDSFSMTVQGTVISDRKWDDSGAAEQNAGSKGYSVMLNPRIAGIMDACFIFKGSNDAQKTLKKTIEPFNYEKTVTFGEYTFGAWVQPLMIPGVNAVIGFSGAFVDQAITDMGFDLRARWVNGPLEIGTFNNLSIAKTNALGNSFTGDTYDKTAKKWVAGDEGRAVAGVAGLGEMTSTKVLWDAVYARYKINGTFTAILTVGQQTELDNNTSVGNVDDGTQIYVHPHVQIYANGGASITAGVVYAQSGIGADKGNALTGVAGKASKTIVAIPVLFRVKM